MYILEKFTEPLLRSWRLPRPFSRSSRPNFGFHLFLMGFHLEFSLFWVSRSFDLSDLGDLRRGSGNFFKNYIFEISAFQRKRWGMSQLCGRKFSLNLFTEEVWFLWSIQYKSPFYISKLCSSRWCISRPYFINILCNCYLDCSTASKKWCNNNNWASNYQYNGWTLVNVHRYGFTQILSAFFYQIWHCLSIHQGIDRKAQNHTSCQLYLKIIFLHGKGWKGKMKLFFLDYEKKISS